MLKLSLVVAVGALAACSSPQDIGNAVGIDSASAAKPVEEPAQETLDRRLAAGAKPREVAVENEQMKFAYSWPAEAVAIATLDAAMEAKAKTERDKFAAMTAEARADAEQYGYPYRAYDFSKSWDAAADTPRFLSLAAGTYAYTGGAHGNTWFDSMIWDRETETEMAQTDLFVSAAALEAAVREAYCTGLKSERAERLGADAGGGTEIFDSCPALEDLVLVLQSTNGTTFDTLELLAAPYVAGSYVEGPYEVKVPVTQAVIAAAKSEYRGAFALGS
ncbi:MAG: DUF4163 domain-containing protein [Erythrobacter sp.]|nr:DUF4163 domain-containing protein [Erythrobacter sp.]